MKEPKTEKLFCYVDESGQDTAGKLFVVAVVVTKKDRDELATYLEIIEKRTKKNQKWSKASATDKVAYLDQILIYARFRNKLFFHLETDTVSYSETTLDTVAAVINTVKKQNNYKAAIFIDGLSRPNWRKTAAGLRKRGVLTEKVRGVNDESHSLIRLADAIAGLVRENLEGHKFAEHLYRIGVKKGTIRQV